jgi:hypothetical protein
VPVPPRIGIADTDPALPAAHGTMAFLFKSKKNADKTQSSRDAPSGALGPQASMQTGMDGRMIQSDSRGTPGSSVNNSLNSLPGHASPSPDQLGRQRGPSADLGQDSPVSARFLAMLRMAAALRSIITHANS